MAQIKVSVEEMGVAANRCDTLANKIEECRQECIALNQQLQAAYEGESARAFEDFVNSTATRVLGQCSEMCSETARGIRHTCEQFSQADRTLSGTFRG